MKITCAHLLIFIFLCSIVIGYASALSDNIPSTTDLITIEPTIQIGVIETTLPQITEPVQENLIVNTLFNLFSELQTPQIKQKFVLIEEHSPLLLDEGKLTFKLTDEIPQIIISNADNKTIDVSTHELNNESKVVIADLSDGPINKRIESGDMTFIIRRG